MMMQLERSGAGPGFQREAVSTVKGCSELYQSHLRSTEEMLILLEGSDLLNNEPESGDVGWSVWE